MTIYVLDYQGTLDQLSRPKGFVRALQSLGHKVILLTGLSSTSVQRRHKGLAEAPDRFVTKGEALLTVIREAVHDWEGATGVIVCDDEPSTEQDVLDLATGSDLAIPITFLAPQDLNAHLSSLA